MSTSFDSEVPTLLLGFPVRLGLAKRLLFFGNDRALGGHFRVQLNVASPLLWDFFLRIDRLHRALRDAGVAIDTHGRIDIEHPLPFSERLYGTNDHAIGVLAIQTWFTNDMRHFPFSFPRKT